MAARQDPFRLILKCMIAAALIVLLVIALLKLLDLLVLVFAAVVAGTLIHALAELIARHSPIKGKLAHYLVIVLLAAILGGFAWLFGSRMSADLARLSQTLVASWGAITGRLAQLPGGAQLVAGLRDVSLSGDQLIPRISTALSVAGAIVTDVILLVFGAVFIAADPGLYRRGLVMLVPRSRRALAEEALCEAGASLRQWILGQFVIMAFIGMAFGLGLGLIGIPSAVALGVIAGLFEIIPYLGPVLAAVPILVMAAGAGQDKLLFALVYVVVIWQIEGNLLSPYVHQKVVSLPPAVSIFGVVAGGVLFGPIGLVFAAPLLIVTFTLVKRLYVEEALHTPTEIPGRD